MHLYKVQCCQNNSSTTQVFGQLQLWYRCRIYTLWRGMLVHKKKPCHELSTGPATSLTVLGIEGHCLWATLYFLMSWGHTKVWSLFCTFMYFKRNGNCNEVVNGHELPMHTSAKVAEETHGSCEFLRINNRAFMSGRRSSRNPSFPITWWLYAP